MPAEIEKLSRAELIKLISTTITPTLTEQQNKKLAQCLKATTTVWTGIYEKKLLGFWGVIPPTLLSDSAYLWFYWTDELANHKFVFTRHSQRVIEEVLKLYPRITGDCEATAEQSQRWLRWLGAKFGEAKDGFLPFVIEARNG